jgi:hypothetical protein
MKSVDFFVNFVMESIFGVHSEREGVCFESSFEYSVSRSVPKELSRDLVVQSS